MNKILTIIIPTYNMENYLSKCLDSLIVSGENMQCLEVLVVNDGSKDSSSQIAHEYEVKYPQTFRVIDKENGNYGSCVNRGLKEATGKYVKVLDADDWFDTSVLDEFVHSLGIIDADLIVTNHCQVNPHGEVERSFNFGFPVGEVFHFDLFDENSINHFYHQNVTYRLDMLLDINYHQTEGISYTDNEWVFKPCMVVRSIMYFPYNLYIYLRGREGQTFDPVVLRRSYDQRLIVFKSMIDYYSKQYSSCSKSNFHFAEDRLMLRFKELYYHYLCIDSTNDGNKKLRSFDKYLQVKTPSLFEKMNKISTRSGLLYVRNWRHSNYNRNTLLLLFLRVKHGIVQRKKN